MPQVNQALRPDRCKVLFEKIFSVFFLGTPDVGFKLTPVVEKQIAAFNREGYSVLINTSDKKLVWLAQGHTKVLIQREWRKAINRVEHGDLWR